MAIPKKAVIARVDKMNPTAEMIRLGTLLDQVITNHNALVAKLDLDAGVTDTNYTALCAFTPIDKRQ